MDLRLTVLNRAFLNQLDFIAILYYILDYLHFDRLLRLKGKSIK